MGNTPDTVYNLQHVWFWMLQTFGLPGTWLVLCLVLLLCLTWLITPVGVWLLYRRSGRLEQHVLELRERTASRSRQQQVERLQRDSVRKKPPRRR
jgi:hypothetical protein